MLFSKRGRIYQKTCGGKLNEIFIGLQDLIELKNISLSEKEEEIRDELQETMDRMRESRKKVLEKHEEKRQR